MAPQKYVVDCSTKIGIYVPLDADELADYQARQQAPNPLASAAQARAEAAAVVKAKAATDPAFAALAHLLGI